MPSMRISLHGIMHKHYVICSKCKLSDTKNQLFKFLRRDSAEKEGIMVCLAHLVNRYLKRVKLDLKVSNLVALIINVVIYRIFSCILFVRVVWVLPVMQEYLDPL